MGVVIKVRKSTVDNTKERYKQMSIQIKGIMFMLLSSILLLTVICGLGITLWKMGVQNDEIKLTARYEAQQNVVETTLFKMQTTVKNMHACTDEWAEKFIRVVIAQAQGRTGGKPSTMSGGLGINVSRESESLGIPSDLYMKLSNAIEGNIADFTRQQDVLTDIWREHTAFCQNPFNNMFGLNMSIKVKPKPEMITSQEAKDAVKTKRVETKLF